MIPLHALLAEYSSWLAQQDLFAEAVGPLLAARRFGAGARAEEIGNSIAWRLADQAIAALEGRRLDEAKELAALGLAAAESVKCLFALCSAFAGADPALLARLGRRLDDAADPADANVRLSVLTWLSAGGLSEGPANGLDLEARLVALLQAHPHLGAAESLLAQVRGALALSPPPGLIATADAARPPIDQIGDALRIVHSRAADFFVLQGGWDRAAAHCAALIALKPESADGCASALQALAENILKAGASADNGGLARLATITLMSQSPVLMATLLSRLWASGDLEGLKAVEAIATTTPFEPTVDWVKVAYFRQIARRAQDALDRASIEREAMDATLRETDRLLEEIPNPAELRVARSYLLIEHYRYKQVRADLSVLLETMKSDKTLEYHHAYPVALHILFLNYKLPTADMARIAEYILRDERSTPDSKEFLFYYCARWGEMALAYQVAARLTPYRESWAILASLQNFMAVGAQSPAAVIGRPRTGKHLIYGNLVCWGKVFIEKMAWASLPSLLADGNIPALVKTNDLCIDLITHHSDVEDILALEGIKSLAEYCEIRIYCFPEEERFFEWAKDLPYVVFGHAQHFTIYRAQQDGADVLPLSADVVYANGCFDFVARQVTDEPRALFYDGMNGAQTPLRESLAPYRVDGVLTIDAPTLARFAVQAMKPIMRHSFFQRSGASIKSSTPTLLFRKPFGMRIYSFMQGVVYASAAALKGLTGFDCLTLEGTCSEVILAKLTPEQVVVRTSTDDILWVELDDADRNELIPLGAEMVPHLDGVRNYFLRYARSLKRFPLFERAVDCHVDGLAFGDVIDDATEAQFLADLRAMRETDPVFTELMV